LRRCDRNRRKLNKEKEDKRKLRKNKKHTNLRGKKKDFKNSKKIEKVLDKLRERERI
jgi:hypothetical protein